MSVAEVYCRGGGGRNSHSNRGCLCSWAFLLAPARLPAVPRPCGGADPARSRDGALAGRADPGGQRGLRCGLPCPSSDSSWQLWRNVLLTAVLINGEHVCVAEIFLSFFSFFFVFPYPLLLFGGNTVKLFISTIKGAGEGFTIFLSQRFPLPQINPFWEQALL